jgi:hypothetical protein
MPSDTYTLVIADAGVSTPADLSVTTGKIVNLAVTTTKLENYTTAGTGITTAKLDNGAVTTVKIADGAVTAAKLETYTTAGTGVTTAKLDNGAVTTAKILNGAVTTAKLETFTSGSTGVTTDKIADLAVTSAKIAATTIVNANISATAAIGLGKLATGALPAGITVATAAACTGNAATATSLAGGSTGAIAYQTGIGTTGFLPVGTAGQILQSNGAAAPEWITRTNTVAGGGTGITSYTAGDILYANTTTTLAKLPAAAAGNVLLSGTTPSYGKVILTTGSTQHVTGTLPVDKGGTGLATITGYVKGAGTSALTAIATIPVADGGTGLATITGYVKGAGTSALTAIATIPVADGGTGFTQSAYGEFYITTIIATVIAAADTPTKVLGTTQSGLLSNFSHSNGRLTYTGTATRKFYVSVSLSFHGSNGTEYSFSIAKDAAPIDASKIQATATGPTNLAHVSSQCIIELLPNAFIEVFVENVVNGDDATIDQMNMSVFPLL